MIKFAKIVLDTIELFSDFTMLRSCLVLPHHGIAVLSGSVDVHYIVQHTYVLVCPRPRDKYIILQIFAVVNTKLLKFKVFMFCTKYACKICSFCGRSIIWNRYLNGLFVK